MYRGIFTAPPTETEGIQMIYLPDRQVIRMEGWFNHRQGALPAFDLPLSDFLRGLGISLDDCRWALEGAPTPSAQPLPAAQNVPSFVDGHSPRNTAEMPTTPPPAPPAPPRTLVNPK